MSKPMPLISKCCKSADLIPPDWEVAEKSGSLWRSYAYYICKECGNACDVVTNSGTCNCINSVGILVNGALVCANCGKLRSELK